MPAARASLFKAAACCKATCIYFGALIYARSNYLYHVYMDGSGYVVFVTTNIVYINKGKCI